MHWVRVARLLLGGLFCLLVMALVGCQRQAELSYNQREEVGKLPDEYQQQIKATLQKYFGTAVSPRYQVPDLEAEESGSDDEDSEPAEVLVHEFEPAVLKVGQAAFNRRCSGCHGVTGDGAGDWAQYLTPKPRDYRRGIFKFGSTIRGSKPTRQDLTRFVRHGARGTSMPAFRWLPDDEMDAIISYVMMLSARGEMEFRLAREAGDLYLEPEELEEGEEQELIEEEYIPEIILEVVDSWHLAHEDVVQPITPMPPVTPESIEAGRLTFMSRECWKCHGKDGRGQTVWLNKEFIANLMQTPEEEREQLNVDDWGNVAPAADLSAGMLHGGRRPVDVYRRIYAGINGTPMPAFSVAFQEEPETMWNLVHFILHVVETGQFPAGSTEEDGAETAAAGSPDDSATALRNRVAASTAE